MSDWLELLPKALAEVPCSGGWHELAWSKGRLVALDHTDLDGERTLAALGGGRCTCVELVSAWERRRTELALLALASRGPADLLLIDAIPLRPGNTVSSSHQVVPPSPLLVFSGVSPANPPGVGWPAPEPEDLAENELLALLCLAGGLSHRLVAETIDHWSQQRPDPAHLPALTAALHGRAAAAVRSWYGSRGVKVSVTMIGPDEQPSYEASNGRARLALPWHWLQRVWAPGFAVTAGRFTLDVLRDGDTLTLLTVGPDGGKPTPMTLTVP